MVWVAFESVELDAVQLLETLPAALAREIVLHLCCVLLHVPVERSTLPALVAADLAPARSQGTVREGRAGPRTGWRHLGLECRWNLVWQPQGGARLWDLLCAGPGPDLLPPSTLGMPVTHCRGVSPVCVRRCTSRWFFLLKDLPQVSQVNSRTPGGNTG